MLRIFFLIGIKTINFKLMKGTTDKNKKKAKIRYMNSRMILCFVWYHHKFHSKSCLLQTMSCIIWLLVKSHLVKLAGLDKRGVHGRAALTARTANGLMSFSTFWCTRKLWSRSHSIMLLMSTFGISIGSNRFKLYHCGL